MSKKFGTFAGVFTPSLLTILGVIMYLRLGWVVGQAGLYAAIGLILLAHVISISTGLSLSSIATDKKIKTGGIYYMLSRSLGLPMGGSIGITLFIGTAFSIALYIVGFVENFISIDIISDFLGMHGSVNDTRIIGTIVIISLVILAYISTSIAIKAQFFILGAIALSLISIFTGIILQPDFQQTAASLNTNPEAPDLIVIFAIFFPAVTGFTAGVAMSGDLKSPKSSIPLGTLASIGVGLVVYLLLAVFFGLYIDRDLLINNTNFLQNIAWFSPLVIAGIWGATLSSALGGLLGAPRILQAMSLDRITPKIFGKGNGKNNEPRQALIFTFIIAEIGILIGELDIIAAIVSMFYIAAYGFINLAYVLESWANSDFRPSLKTPKWVGIIGFIASMGVMFKLDTLAMSVAILILIAIYFFLKRREIKGNMSNVWQSVWTSLARSSLHKINQNPLNEKNWEPNIILFSGGTLARPQLLDLGSSFVGDHGFLSNFDLVEKTDERFLFAKRDQNINSELSDKYPGVFTRQQSVKNIYEGMEMIAQTYGFSGVEPNTIMMGWERQSKDPQRFVKSIKTLAELDMNVLLVDYNEKRSFGNFKKIDVWWRGGSRNGNLALYLSKFLINSEMWSGAKIRLIIVNKQTEFTSTIYETTKSILENLRIDVELIVIDNEVEQKSFYDIIQEESINSDLTFLGFPSLEHGKEEDFVGNINRLCKNIGSVVLIKSSSLFKELHLGELFAVDSYKKVDLLEAREMTSAKATSPDNALISPYFDQFASNLQSIQTLFTSTTLTAIEEFQSKSIQQLSKIVDHSFQNLGSRLDSLQTTDSFKKIIVAQHSILLRTHNQFLIDLRDKQIPILTQKLNPEIERFSSLLNACIQQVPSQIKISRTKEEIRANKDDDKSIRKVKNRVKPFLLIFSKIPYFVNFQALIDTHFPQKSNNNIYQTLIEYDQLNNKMGNALVNCMFKISDVFETLKPENNENKLPSLEVLEAKQNQIRSFIKDLTTSLDDNVRNIGYNSSKRLIDDLNILSSQLSALFPNVHENHKIDFHAYNKQLKKQLKSFPDHYSQNLILINNQNILNNGLLQFNHQTRLYLRQEQSDLLQNINEDCVAPIASLKTALLNLKEKDQATSIKVKEIIQSYRPNMEVSVSQQLLDLNNTRNKKIKSATSIFPEKLKLYSESLSKENKTQQFTILQGVEASVSRTIDYLVEKEISDDLREFLFKFGSEIQLLKNEFNKLSQQFIHYDEQKTEASESLDWDNFFSLSIDNFSALETEFGHKIQELSNYFDSKDLDLRKALNLHTFVADLTKLKQYIRVQSTKHKFDSLRKQIKIVNSFLINQLNKLWYNQSSGLILARKLSKSMLIRETRVDDLLHFKESIGISPRILKQLPDYYKQLFLRKQFYLKDFWVGRSTEFASAEQSIGYFRSGYKGGILVTGERASGKSFFLNQLVDRISVQGEVFHITAPYTGSTSPTDLLTSFRIAIEKKGSYSLLLNSIPNESVFIIDDLELWWEKSPNGMRVIDQLMKLIAEYSHKHLFILACDINAFVLINHYRKIESNFINLIELAPLNAKEIKEAILKRHTSSGMQFSYNNTPESGFHSWNYARLFSRYFNYSEGNIGVALQNWIAHITKIENNTLYIKKPILPDYSVLNYLETDWMIFIMQFILHKRMNYNKLIRITRDTEASVTRKVNILIRAGLIDQKADGILELNAYLMPYLQKALMKRQML